MGSADVSQNSNIIILETCFSSVLKNRAYIESTFMNIRSHVPTVCIRRVHITIRKTRSRLWMEISCAAKRSARTHTCLRSSLRMQERAISTRTRHHTRQDRPRSSHAGHTTRLDLDESHLPRHVPILMRSLAVVQVIQVVLHGLIVSGVNPLVVKTRSSSSLVLPFDAFEACGRVPPSMMNCAARQYGRQPRAPCQSLAS